MISSLPASSVPHHRVRSHFTEPRPDRTCSLRANDCRAGFLHFGPPHAATADRRGSVGGSLMLARRNMIGGSWAASRLRRNSLGPVTRLERHPNPVLGPEGNQTDWLDDMAGRKPEAITLRDRGEGDLRLGHGKTVADADPGSTAER